MEMTRNELLTIVVFGSFLATMAWFVMSWTVVALLRRRTLRRWSEQNPPLPSEMPVVCGVPVADYESARKVLDAHADLSLAAIDMPGEGMTTDGMHPQLRELVVAAQRYKAILPDYNQEMLRAERRSRTENAKFIADE